MGSERWERVKSLVEEALERESSERARFLEESCADDPSLRAEVESLLRYERDDSLEAVETEEHVVGRSLSHYRVVGEIGRGGMGRVYRARDEKLGRSVAIKLLPRELASSPERIRRFEREARLIAALNHPNVAAIHGLEQTDGLRFLVLELVEGETLQERLGRGPVPVSEALALAQQIADALEAAHEKGVVHRDLKPSNVKVTELGVVKVLDFGLAKAQRGYSSGGQISAATDAEPTTREGVVLGTPAYMSPEQVGGLSLDHRADVWSFGVLVWEMLTGRRLFEGESTAEIMGAVLRDEPGWAELPSGVPSPMLTLLRRCLTRDRRYRLQSIGEARILIEECRAGGGSLAGSGFPQGQLASIVQPGALSRAKGSWLAAALLVSLGGLAFAFLGRHRPDERAATVLPLRKWSLTPTQQLYVTTMNADVKLSPNGRFIAYHGDNAVWVWDLEERRPRRLENTEGGIDPFWSPDSAYVGYFKNGEVMKIPEPGGTPTRVCSIPAGEPWGASWSPDGEVILVSSGFPGHLYEVSARGGDPKLVLDPEVESTAGGPPLRSIYRPCFLPAEAGRRVVLFAFGVRSASNVMVWDLDTGRHRVLGVGALPVYSPSGHVVYQETGLVYRLWAAPFSLETLDLTGRPFLIAEPGRDPVVAGDGTLAYVDADLPRVQLTWFDRTGHKVGELGRPERCLGYPAVSPDETRIAVVGGEDRNYRDAWIYDVARGVRTRLTAAPENFWNVFSPRWSPRGDEIAFTVSNRDLQLRRADGGGSARTILSTANYHDLGDWSSDGRYLLIETRNPKTGGDLAYLERGESDVWELHPFLATPFNEHEPRLAPSGQYVAYVSNESGRDDVYLRPFPEGSGKWLVSSAGGRLPVWSRDGRELFYLDGRERLLSIAVSADSGLSLGAPATLFEFPEIHIDFPWYDVSRDGSRFLVPAVVSQQPRPVIHVVQSWASEFVGTR